jgi:pimeloyl-ACP methyl ester carboxylesterase
VARSLGTRFRAVTFDQRGVGESSCDGSYRAEDYLADIDAVRAHLGVGTVHLLGHSWGGLLAQLYASEFPDRVASLCLLNSAAGVGEHWIQTEREVLAYNRRRSGLVGFAILGAWAVAAYLPGRVGEIAGRQVLARAWRDYFTPSEAAPPVDRQWLNGSNIEAARRSVKTVRKLPSSMLGDSRRVTDLPVLSLLRRQRHLRPEHSEP